MAQNDRTDTQGSQDESQRDNHQDNGRRGGPDTRDTSMNAANRDQNPGTDDTAHEAEESVNATRGTAGAAPNRNRRQDDLRQQADGTEQGQSDAMRGSGAQNAGQQGAGKQGAGPQGERRTGQQHERT